MKLLTEPAKQARKPERFLQGSFLKTNLHLDIVREPKTKKVLIELLI
jgi:hypothetical protein